MESTSTLIGILTALRAGALGFVAAPLSGRTARSPGWVLSSTGPVMTARVEHATTG
jgi:hypothetical protein